MASVPSAPAGRQREVLLAFLGWPSLAHSWTAPGLEAWLACCGRAGRCLALPTPPERLEATLEDLARRGCRGVNLTTPHKGAAFRLARSLDASARATGAVNGLRLDAEGWAGTNSDLPGLAEALRHDVPLDLAGREAAVLGSGGAARAAVAALREVGAARVAILGLDAEEGRALAREVPGPPRVDVLPLREPGILEREVPEAALLVQATPLGLQPEDPLPVDLPSSPRPDLVVMDLIYRPARTRLLQEAERRGLRVVNGWPMWVHQARALVAFLLDEPPSPGPFRCDDPGGAFSERREAGTTPSF